MQADKGDKRTAHIPVILLTARQAVESKVKGLETGADDYVTKPFNMTVLVLRIRKLIELSRYHRSAQTSTIDPAPSEILITSLDEKLIESSEICGRKHFEKRFVGRGIEP